MEAGGMEGSAQQSNETGTMQKVIGVIASPGKAFESIVTNPRWLVPFLITAVIGLVFVLLTADILIDDTLSQQEKAMVQQGLDDEMIEQRLEATEKFMGFEIAGVPVTLAFFAVVWPLVYWFFIALAYFIVGKLLGGEAGFKDVFGVTAWSWVVQAIGGLLLLPLVLAQQTILVTLSPAALLSDESRLTFVYQFLSKIDVFNIWFIAVLSIGLAVLFKMETRKMAIAAFSVFVLWALGSAGWTVMFS